MRPRLIAPFLFSAALILAAGCTQEMTEPGPAPPAAKSSEHLLGSEPEGALGVCDVRASTEDEVVVVGRIGGQADPWVEGAAAFVLVDTALVPCNERPGDNCPVPWDYCCDDASTLNDSKLLVQVVDADGRLIETAARDLLGVKELDTVVIRGRAERDEAGNVTVLAQGLFIRP